MTEATPYDGAVPGEMPASAWALGLSCVVGQLLQLAASGPADTAISVALSVPINVLVFAWVSAGVLNARRWRTAFAVVVFAIQVVFGAIGLAAGDLGGVSILSFVATTAAVVSLVAFTRTDYHTWRTAHPQAPGPSIVGLLVLAGVVGALSGTTDHSPDDDPSTGFELRVGT